MDTTCLRGVDDAAADFYVAALTTLRAAGVPFMIGGAFAFARYVNLDRDTKDLDVFIRREDLKQTLDALSAAGYQTNVPYPHWLAKAWSGDHFIDLIFSSGNGLARVDNVWLEHAVAEDVLGIPVLLSPPEEMIWSKAFIQERERHDGADVMHLLRELGSSLDWERILTRFGDHWPVLLSHVVMFRFVYPDRREQVPGWVVEDLLRRFADQRQEPDVRVCNGTLLSREQYLTDVSSLGYEDARVVPRGHMTEEETAIWTAAISHP
jgi:hypothetical protein